MYVLSSPTIDRKLESFVSIFEIKVIINFESNIEGFFFVNFEFIFKIFVNLESN